MNEMMMVGGVSMSSREIADYTGSSHDNVLKTIRRLISEGVIFGNETPYRHPQNGQLYLQFLLSFRDTMVVVSGYNADIRARVIDRWQELEAQRMPASPVVPTTLSGALRLAADQAEQIEKQQAALAIAAPKVEFVDRYVDSTGNKGFREVAKLLGANEARFREFLLTKGVMYRLAGSLTPMAQHLDAGRFVVKAGANEESGHAFTQAKFTAKGIAWIAGQWMEWKLEQGEGS